MKRRSATGVGAASALALCLAAGCSAISGLGGLSFDGSGAGATGGAGGGIHAGGSGGAAECAHASDCGPRACIDVSCPDHVCVVAASAAETPCDGGVCDGHGSCVECVNASDCPAASECHVRSCVSRSCVLAVAGAGTACGSSLNLVCDGAGHCVGCNHDADCTGNRSCDSNHTCQDLCSDGIKDYDESDVDCGGSCPTCPNGKLCATNVDCASDYCVDGYCCNSDCSFACEACNLAGSLGDCQPLPKNTEDPGICDSLHGTCGGQCACSQTGDCKLATGSMCSQDSDCASGICGVGSGLCKP